MNLPKFATVEQAFSFALKGHAGATAFISMVCNALHIWDDIKDGDKPLTIKHTDDMMYLALVALPRSTFYQENFALLNPILEVAILNWHAANAMEATDSLDDKRIAFIIRSDYCNLLIACARIVGGYEWAMQITPTIRRFWHDEGFDGYLKNLTTQAEAQNGML